MRKIIYYSLVVIFGVFLSCTNNTEFEERLEALEKKVENLSANKVINNPNTASNPSGVTEGPLSEIKFDEPEFDFGDINSGDIVTHIFKFKNTGDAPLIIESATASCGCTVPKWPKEPIPPGEESEIEVKYDSKNKAGIQQKTITIRANTQPNVTRLIIKANVFKTGTDNTVTPLKKVPK